MLSKTQAVFAGEKWGVRQIAAELMWFASLEMQRTGLARPLRAKGNCFFFHSSVWLLPEQGSSRDKCGKGVLKLEKSV